MPMEFPPWPSQSRRYSRRWSDSSVGIRSSRPLSPDSRPTLSSGGDAISGASGAPGSALFTGGSTRWSLAVQPAADVHLEALVLRDVEGIAVGIEAAVLGHRAVARPLAHTIVGQRIEEV